MTMTLNPSARAAGTLSHMPFLARQGNRVVVVFGQSHEPGTRVPRYGRTRIGRLWKLRRTEISADQLTRAGLDVDDSKPIETGLEPNEVECSPCLSIDEKQTRLSFIGTLGHGTGPLRHRLYRMSGANLDTLEPAELVSDEHCYCGFWRPDLTVTGDGGGLLRLQFSKGESRMLDTGFERVARVSYRADLLNHLLVTGNNGPPGTYAHARTLVYDTTAERVIGEIRANGAPTYKPGVYGGLMLLPEELPNADRGWRLGLGRAIQMANVDWRFQRLA